MASSPPRKRCVPLGPAPGLLVFTGMNAGVLLTSTASSLPWAVSVGRHDVEHFHLALHDDAVGLAVDKAEIGAAAVDRVAVNSAIALEPVEVLVHDCLADALEHQRLALQRGLAAEEGRVDRLSE